MRVLDLFSGVGGWSLGLERAGFETVAFCELDSACVRVLQKQWPKIPIYRNIRDLTYDSLKDDRIDNIEFITGSYPCQPYSIAGKQRGSSDDRAIWHEMYRVIKEVRPRWVAAENVTGHINLGFHEVSLDLENAGYIWWPFVIPACACDASQRRDRIIILGYTDDYGSHSKKKTRKGNSTSKKIKKKTSFNFGGTIEPGDYETLDTYLRTRNWEEGSKKRHRQGSFRSRKFTRWLPEPKLRRVVAGVPTRVDENRLMMLGNSISPRLTEIIGHVIMAHEANL